MDYDYFYTTEMYKKFDFKLNIFDDQFSSELTGKTVANIIMTKNNDFINFCSLYFFLFEQRINNLSNKSHPILSEKIWPKINYSRTVILNFLENKKDDEFKKMVKYFVNEVKPIIEGYKNDLIIEYQKLISKISTEKKIIIESNYRKEILIIQKTLKYGIELNDLAVLFHQINILKDKIDELIMLIKDEKRYKFNFYLSLSLAIFSIILSLVSFVF